MQVPVYLFGARNLLRAESPDEKGARKVHAAERGAGPP